MKTNLNVSYNETFYNSTDLKQAAQAYLKFLPSDVNVLVSQGHSGCSIGAAMLALSRRKLRHICRRKEGENAHSSTYAGSASLGLIDPMSEKVCIVDDFISTGRSVEALVEWIRFCNPGLTINVMVGYCNQKHWLEKYSRIYLIEVQNKLKRAGK